MFRATSSQRTAKQASRHTEDDWKAEILCTVIGGNKLLDKNQSITNKEILKNKEDQLLS